MLFINRRGYFLIVVVLHMTCCISKESKVNVDKSIAWGPGLSPTKLIFPARYFFVKLYDNFGNPFEKPLKNNLDVHISGKGKSGNCRIWSDILLRKDGSYIVRYKLYETCYSLKIDLRYNNMPIKDFPKVFHDIVYSDDCNCPQKLDIWLKDMKCKKKYSQITEDLKPFQSVKFNAVHKKILKKFTNHKSISLCHYVVKGNKVFRKCYGEYVGFKIFTDAILHSLARKVFLPDFEFFVNLGDWPLEDRSSSPLPIFSWCGSDRTSDILMPTYDLTEATLECMGRVVKDMLSVQGNTGLEWKDKINKAFWRGRDSSPERLHLVDLSRKYPHLINASLTNFFFYLNKEKEYGPKADLVPFFDFFQYKYQINLDGTVAAYRLPFLLAGDSVVLKQESQYFEHFYRNLIPNVHYVPFKKDLSNLIEVIENLQKNDDLARNISLQAQDFVRKNLMPKDIFCYFAVLFKEWSSRLEEVPQVLEDMEQVPQPSSENCQCKRTSLKDEL